MQRNLFDQAKDEYQDIKDDVNKADEWVHTNTLLTIAIGFISGLIIGYLIGC